MPAGGKTRDASTTLEPAPSVSLGTNLPVHQALISAKSFTSAQTKQRSRAKLKFRSENPILIIGFDAEWVTEPPEPPDEEGDELEGDGDNDRILPDQIPRNRILSYQYACRYGDREWSGIIYTSAGARLRHSERTDAQIAEYPERIRFDKLLAAAIEHGIRDKHLTRWPKHVSAAAHWTRADYGQGDDNGHRSAVRAPVKQQRPKNDPHLLPAGQNSCRAESWIPCRPFDYLRPNLTFPLASPPAHPFWFWRSCVPAFPAIRWPQTTAPNL
jgi:hypothetical protein